VNRLFEATDARRHLIALEIRWFAKGTTPVAASLGPLSFAVDPHVFVAPHRSFKFSKSRSGQFKTMKTWGLLYGGGRNFVDIFEKVA